eukprot:1153840-Pelagomonas_calceolata.AAC.9
MPCATALRSYCLSLLLFMPCAGSGSGAHPPLTHPCATPNVNAHAQHFLVVVYCVGSPGEKAGPLSGASPNAAATPHASAPSPTPAAPTPVVKSGGSSGQLAERAYHPDEVRASGGQLMVDVEYYLANQVGVWR